MDAAGAAGGGVGGGDDDDDADDAVHGDDGRAMGIGQLLRILDGFVFPPSRTPQDPTRSSMADGDDPDEEQEEILERASVLAEVACVWSRFGLPVPALETALRPRLPAPHSARVLTALFFPQLSAGGSVGEASSPPPPPRALGYRPGTGAMAKSRQPAPASLGPTRAQVECAGNLGLSPRFHLALVQAGARVAASGSRGGRTGAGAGAGAAPAVPGMRKPPSPFVSPPRLFVHDRWASSPPPLAVLLDTRSDGRNASTIRMPPRAEAGGTGGESRRMSGSGGEARDPSLDGHGSDLVCFSCGHSFSREHLLRVVVPACVSSLHHATSSLQRTEQVLTREYGRRGRIGVACPDCVSKELRRLVSGLRPAGGGPDAFLARANTVQLPHLAPSLGTRQMSAL